MDDVERGTEALRGFTRRLDDEGEFVDLRGLVAGLADDREGICLLDFFTFGAAHCSNFTAQLLTPVERDGQVHSSALAGAAHTEQEAGHRAQGRRARGGAGPY